MECRVYMKNTYELEIEGKYMRIISKGDVFYDTNQDSSYYVIGFATNTETNEILLLYTNMAALYAEVLASPLSIFLSAEDQDVSSEDGDEGGDAHRRFRFIYSSHFDSIEELLLFKSITAY